MKLRFAVPLLVATSLAAHAEPAPKDLSGCVDAYAALRSKLARLREPVEESTGLGLLLKAPNASLEAERAGDQAAMLARAQMKGKTYDQCHLALILERGSWLCPLPGRRDTSFLGKYNKDKADRAYASWRSCLDAYDSSLSPEEARLVEAAKNTPEALFGRWEYRHAQLAQGKEPPKDGEEVCAKLDEPKRAEAAAKGKADGLKWAAERLASEKALLKAKQMQEADKLMREHPDCLVPSFRSFGCESWRRPWRRDKVTLAIEVCSRKTGSYTFGCVVDKLAHSGWEAQVEALKAEAIKTPKKAPRK